MLPNCHPIGRMFVTPRIWQRMAATAQEFLPRTPLRMSFSYPATTPPLPHAGRITIFVEAWSAWARSDGFTGATEEWIALAERLKLTPCPHCKVVGTLIRHGYLRGYDESNPQRKTVRARRVFCSNRQARRGCGRTFSVWCADKIRHLSLTTSALWRFLQRAAAGCIVAAIRAVDCQLSDRTWQRIWKRFDRGQSKIRTALSGCCPPPELPPQPRAAAGGARPGPSPGRLPRRPLSHRRLPAYAADLLRLGTVRQSIFRVCRKSAGRPLDRRPIFRLPDGAWPGSRVSADTPLTETVRRGGRASRRRSPPNCQRISRTPPPANPAEIPDNA